MKKFYTLITIFAFPLLAYSQNPMIFQPGPGANDTTDHGGINGGKDTWTNEGDGNYNGGADPYLVSLPISNCNATNTVAYVQFDLTGLPSSPDSVFFGVTHYDHTTYCYSNCNADFYFAAVISPWDEMTANYNSFPDWNTPFYGPINVAFPNSFGNREYNITSMYNQWKNGSVPNYGFAIYSPTVGCNNAAVYFEVHSSDDTTATSRPYLKIYDSSLGVNAQNEKLGVSIYPNPASDFLSINCASSTMSRVELYNVLGDKIKEEMVQSKDYKMNVQGLNQGIYFLHIQTEQGDVIRKVQIGQ